MMRICGILALVGLVACSNAPTNEPSPAADAASRITGTTPQVDRFAALLRTGPAALQIGIIDQDIAGTILLEQRKGAFETWLSPDGATVTLENGLLHSTRGLGAGLLASELSQSNALVSARRPGATERLHTFLMGDDRAITRVFRCTVESEGPRDVTLNVGVVQAELMSEDCNSLDQSFRNLYWVDSRGQIVQSRQWAGDFLGFMSTRVVR